MKADVGVIVGRFQVHQLHQAHHDIIRPVYQSHRQTLIVLGVSQARVSSRNPLPVEARKQMLLADYPEATVLFISDEPTDEGWSAHLDHLIDNYVSVAQTVRLYGGRDSFAAHYKGHHPVTTLEPESYISGTELRKDIARDVVRATQDFRAGVIWASANGYPKVFPTVDVAIYRYTPTEPYVEYNRHDGPPEIPVPTVDWLLVRKPHEKLWRFPGGFVAPTDGSLEAAARREATEEIGVALGDLRYVWSGIVDDWRYQRETDKIMTTLFMAPYLFGPVRPADDVAEAKWTTRYDISLLVPEHRPLADALAKENTCD